MQPDFIGRLETIGEDWTWLVGRYGLPPLTLENRSAQSPVAIQPVALAKIIAAYQVDYERFRYGDRADAC